MKTAFMRQLVSSVNFVWRLAGPAVKRRGPGPRVSSIVNEPWGHTGPDVGGGCGVCPGAQHAPC